MLHVPTVAKVKQQRRDDVHVRLHMLLQLLYTAYDDMYMTVHVHAVDVCTCTCRVVASRRVFADVY